jgi:hypothetical protein
MIRMLSKVSSPRISWDKVVRLSKDWPQFQGMLEVTLLRTVERGFKTRRLYFLVGIIILSTVGEADERWDSVPH